MDISPWEDLKTEPTQLSLGPYHRALPGPMVLKLQMDGERMVDVEVETGFLHRGIEATMQAQTWDAALVFADRLEPEASVFAEWAYVQAVEQIHQIEVPPRAEQIRTLLAEMSRISSHLAFFARLAKACEFSTAMHFALRDRERWLDLFELQSGVRFCVHALRVGGVGHDVSDGFVDRVLDTCDLMQVRLKELRDLVLFHAAFMQRVGYLAVLPQDRAQALGLTGPNARGSQLSVDVRKQHPHGVYERLQWEVPLGVGESGLPGDVHDRAWVRAEEIEQSLLMIRQVCERLTVGPFQAKPASTSAPPSGEGLGRVESPRGRLFCHVVSSGKEQPMRVQFQTPSQQVLAVLPELLRGERIEDVGVILASFDISIAEADR